MFIKPVDKPVEKSSTLQAKPVKPELSSTIASLFEPIPSHPWSKEGEINFGSYASGGMGGGGILGIKGGMPRMPSFKVGITIKYFIMLFWHLYYILY